LIRSGKTVGFKKGESGNPAGRPRGIVNQAKLRASIAKDLPEILEAMVLAAKSGDTTAARLLLDRALPSLKAVDGPAPIALDQDLAGADSAVLLALAAGNVTLDQAGALAGILASLARIEETVNLAARVTALEKAKP
jgi:hypothetical protein